MTVSRFDLEHHPNFIAMVGACERLKAGETLDPVEEAELRRYMNHPQTDADQEIIDEVLKRYQAESSRFLEDAAPASGQTPSSVMPPSSLPARPAAGAPVSP